VASVIGLVLSRDALLQDELFSAVRDAFPGSLGGRLVDQLTSAIDSAGVVGLIGLVGFLYAGLRTMDKLRIGMERIWKGHVDEPAMLRDNLQDLVALVVLGAVGLSSLGLTGGVTQATSWVLRLLGLADEPGYGVLTWTVGILLALAVDTAVFFWLLRVVPSTSHPLRMLLPGARFGAVGFEGLKLIGGFYLSLISDSVTASALGGAVGLLVWINLVARFAFFTAAWTATLRSIEALPRPPAEGPTRRGQ
jgi:membrane protein